jgi:hypothetical protein
VWTSAAPPVQQCPGCDYRIELQHPEERALSACAVCGEKELYRKKAFPHWLGMLLLVLACIGFMFANGLRRYWAAWGILLGSALIDGLLYMTVGDVVVCYHCNAHHRGFLANPVHGPFELSIGERYRQEKLRREQMQAEKHQ